MSANEFEGFQENQFDCQQTCARKNAEDVQAKSFDINEPITDKGLPTKFVISFSEDDDGKADSLQDAFTRYQKKRQKELRRTRKRRDFPDEARTRSQADPEQMWNLRMMFLNQAKKYFGTPYAKKYWTTQDPEYYSSRFLDCCGLIRQVLRDLKKEFGFRIGPWNQSYLCDTLPITIQKEEDMKPGDLVFISAIYNTKMKKQKHNLTHVEIWLGDGPKTIGARWQKGKVQVFDSYQFNATSYHSPVYIFKSIDTWLMGICRSHCPEHTWKWRSEVFTPGKKSIFYANPQLIQDTRHEQDEDASDTEEELTRTSPQEAQGSQAVLHEPSNLMMGTPESNARRTVGLTHDAEVASLCGEAHDTNVLLKSSLASVLNSGDAIQCPDCLDHDQESCIPEGCIGDNGDRIFHPQSPNCESCDGLSDNHSIFPLNCDKKDSYEMLNHANGDFPHNLHDPDFQNISTDMLSSCLSPEDVKCPTMLENDKALLSFHKLSLKQLCNDNSSTDAI